MANYNNLIDDKGNVSETRVGLTLLRWIIGIGLIVSIASGFFWYTNNRAAIVAAPLQKEREMVEAQNSGARALEADRFFFDTYNNIIARQNDITSSQAALDQFTKDNPKPWNYAAQQQYGNLTQTLQGQKSDLQRMVAEYNSRSDQWGSNVYKSDRLPRKISLDNLPKEPLY